MDKNKTIGMVDKSPVHYSKSGIYGGDIAEQEFIQKLINYTKYNFIEFINFRGLFHDTVIKRKYQNADERIKRADKINIMQRNELSDVDILHDTYGEFMKLLMFRDLYTKKKPPITYIMHCTSAPEYPMNTYLMQCLFDFQPYDSFICTSNAMKKVVQYYVESMQEKLERLYNTKAKYEGRLDVIPLGVDLQKYHPIDRNLCREQLNIPQDAFVILYHGRINFYYKADLYPLITVVKRLVKKNNKRILLVISGQDSSQLNAYEYLKDYIKKNNVQENVMILDEADCDNATIYNAANVFTSPSDNVQECFGLTVIEAMACGIPQVVSEWDGYKETVLHGQTGFLIPTYWADCTEDLSSFPLFDRAGEWGNTSLYSHFLMSQSTAIDLEEYENAFQLLVDNVELQNKMSENSLKRARDVYAWNHIITQYDELWDELLSIKNSIAYNPSRALELFNNEYKKAFIHYPTCVIDETSLLILNTEGREILSSNGKLQIHFKYESLLPEYTLAREILNCFINDSTKTVGEILDFFQGKFIRDVILRSAMLLVKQGYLTIILDKA